MNSLLLARCLNVLAARIMSRPPSQIIGPPSDPYMLRWRLLPKGPWPNIYFHEFHRSDDARALHDHPTDNVSVILDGAYLEVFREGPPYMTGFERRSVGDIVFRLATTPHRIALFDGPHGPQPVRTAFICGPRRRDWGFWCPIGRFVKWQDFVTVTSQGNEQGKGCEQ